VHTVEGRVRLKPSEDERIRNGHVWIYDNELADVDLGKAAAGEAGDGALVWVEDAAGRKLGSGFIDMKSAIRVRLVTRGAHKPFDAAQAEGLLGRALSRREHLGPDCVRLVNAEGDYLPGLVIDRYGGTVVVQPHVPAWERPELEAAIVNSVVSNINPCSLLFKTRGGLRRAEGSPAVFSPVAEGDRDATERIREANLDFDVDIYGGHKTGFYIDQRENRLSMLPYVRGRRVLDCFCYTGAWSCMCAAAGAARVTGVDSSRPALELAGANAKLNGLEGRVEFVEADVFDYLPALAREKWKFDVVILDPPAMAKTRRQVAGAMRGYIHLNKVAMGLIEPGGVLVTCSCSHHMTRERFMEMLRHTSTLVRKRAAVLRIGGQPEDHPSLLGVPETDYLKCVSLRLE
jgi:23S rRNA (cytosine1962-C5)-methyltransferase